MSYMLCPICGEANGVVGITIFQCRCARERQAGGISNVGIPVELESGKAVLPDSGSGDISGNSNHYFQQVRMDTLRIDLNVQLIAAEARRNEAKWVRSPEEVKARCAELDKEIASLRAGGASEQAYHARGAGREERLMADCHRLCGTDLVGWYGRCECGEDFEFDYEYLQHQVKVYQAKLDALKREPGADTGTTPPEGLSQLLTKLNEFFVYCFGPDSNEWPGTVGEFFDEFQQMLRAATQRAPVEQGQPAVANIDLPRNEFEAAWAHYASTAPGTATEKNVFMAGWNAAAPDHAREGALRDLVAKWRGLRGVDWGAEPDGWKVTFNVCADELERALADEKEGGE